MIFNRPNDAMRQCFVLYLVDDARIRCEIFPDRLRPAEWSIVSKGKRARITLLRGDGPTYAVSDVWWNGPLTTTGVIMVWAEKDIVVASWDRTKPVTLEAIDTITAEGLRIVV